MKRILIGVILCFSIFLIAGCNEEPEKESATKEEERVELKSGTLICTKSETIDGLPTSYNVTVNYTDNVINTIKNETTTKVASNQVNYFKEVYDGLKTVYEGIRGITINTEAGTDYVKSIFEINYDILDTEALKKKMEALGEEESDSSIVIDDADLDIERYKKTFLDGFQCN